ncbi:uncharacterized protein (DUF2062 family) [Catalinimonas alkaloidigena]|uniref:DUF2062 domain-containing protein n=1 Tax=Catalinimonas alkaloidigena TaxID=1075417 RepID=UPI0024063FA8|nr:DUF2062 domain-containing protein [Catalinimonas alkaloidigena]MDF9800056.1 uncharacterized protein (DUF2062 family) [Catalinimonas alkaloidigena]
MSRSKASLHLQGIDKQGTNMITKFRQSRIGKMVLGLLRQGMSAKKLSLTISLGVVLGVIPVFGFITAVCAAIAAWWRLNIPLALAVLYAVMPLQIILFVPFIRLGELLFRIEKLPLAPTKIIEDLQVDTIGYMLQIWHSVLGALGAWALVSAFLGCGLYFLSLVLILRFKKKKPL